MISLQYDARVRGEQYQDLLRQAAQERLLTSVSALPFVLLQRASRWLDSQITQLRCALFPATVSQACTP